MANQINQSQQPSYTPEASGGVVHGATSIFNGNTVAKLDTKPQNHVDNSPITNDSISNSKGELNAMLISKPPVYESLFLTDIDELPSYEAMFPITLSQPDETTSTTTLATYQSQGARPKTTSRSSKSAEITATTEIDKVSSVACVNFETTIDRAFETTRCTMDEADDYPDDSVKHIFNIVKHQDLDLLNSIVNHPHKTTHCKTQQEEILKIHISLINLRNLLLNDVSNGYVGTSSFSQNNTVVYEIDTTIYNRIIKATNLINKLTFFINKPEDQNSLGALSVFIHQTSYLQIIKKRVIDRTMDDLMPYTAFSIEIIKKINIQLIKEYMHIIELLSILNTLEDTFFIRLRETLDLSTEYINNTAHINSQDIIQLLQEESNKKLILSSLDMLSSKILMQHPETLFNNWHISLLIYFIFGETSKVFSLINTIYNYIQKNHMLLFQNNIPKNYKVIPADENNDKLIAINIKELNDEIKKFMGIFKTYYSLIDYMLQKDGNQQLLSNNIETSLHLYRFLKYIAACIDSYAITAKLDDQAQSAAIKRLPRFTLLNDSYTAKLEQRFNKIKIIEIKDDKPTRKHTNSKTTKKSPVTQPDQQHQNPSTQTDELIQSILANPKKLNSLEQPKKNEIIQSILNNPEKLTRLNHQKKDILLECILNDETILNQLQNQQKNILLECILNSPRGLTNLTDVNYRIIFELMLHKSMQTTNYKNSYTMFSRLTTINNTFAKVLGEYGITETILRELNDLMFPIRKQSDTQLILYKVSNLLKNDRLLNDPALTQKFKHITILYYKTRIEREELIINKIKLLEKLLNNITQQYIKEPNKFEFLSGAIKYLCKDRADIIEQIKIFDSIIKELPPLHKKRKTLLKKHNLFAKTQKEINEKISALSIKFQQTKPTLSKYFSTALSNKIAAHDLIIHAEDDD